MRRRLTLFQCRLDICFQLTDLIFDVSALAFQSFCLFFEVALLVVGNGHFVFRGFFSRAFICLFISDFKSFTNCSKSSLFSRISVWYWLANPTASRVNWARSAGEPEISTTSPPGKLRVKSSLLRLRKPDHPAACSNFGYYREPLEPAGVRLVVP